MWLCGYDNSLKHVIFRHCLTHFDQEVTCDICGLISKNSRTLQDHKKYKHSVEGQTICRTCNKSFLNEDFSNHKCSQIICNECGKILKSKICLEKHIQNIHRINEKSHICNICGKGFTSKALLKIHFGSQHENKEPPIPCPECGAKVKNLRNHMRFVHTPDEERKFQCQQCGKGFDHMKNLDQHMMNKHLKLKPYNCRYGCEISYNDKSNRNHHERRQHGKLFISVEEEKLKK